ncbi:glycosyltransferase family 2 protein [Aureimonas frigidaquae]|uniref:glycosyltransferase family 2 protein n=1 Tax=Aureimonas frigidaquae TaxID=424757 RepID=UPI0009FA129C|nr:glycosyltransferase family 2 protein [Aureimonas frigidaquae]
MTEAWVVIPFFQRSPGILSRAVRSVLAQDRAAAGIIVVDDESPVDAAAELKGLDLRSMPIRVIRQPNAGPGGARNTGLANLPGSATHVAFLDSDDEWHPGHLAAALQAMERHGADVFFGTISGGAGFDYHSDMSALAAEPGVTMLSTDPMVLTAPDMANRMLEDWSYLHLSAMVIARPLFEGLRFAPDLRLAAEDILFFHDAFRAAHRAILSAAPAAGRGEGANIFHGVDNQAPDYLRQQFITLSALQRLAARPGLNASGAQALERRQERARREALWGQAARLRRGKAPQWKLLGQWARRDPRILRALAGLGLSRLRKGQPTGQPSDKVRNP